jgi:hypothetical protein
VVAPRDGSTDEQAPASMTRTGKMAEATAAVSGARRGPAARGAEPARRRTWIIAAVAGLALAAGCAPSGPAPAGASDSRSLAGVVACAETITVGTVTSVRGQGDGLAVTVGATRYLKPADGPAVLSISAARPPAGGSGAMPAVGERMLVVVHDAANGDVDLFTGADIDPELAWMEQALPDARAIDPKECAGE